MITDLDKLKELTQHKLYYSETLQTFPMLEYKFGKNLNISTALKNFDYLDLSTQKALETLMMLQFLAGEKVSISEVNDNEKLLINAYKRAISVNLTYSNGEVFEEFLNNWGENQDFIYKGVDFSKCLHMRIGYLVVPGMLKELNYAIKKETS